MNILIRSIYIFIFRQVHRKILLMPSYCLLMIVLTSSLLQSLAPDSILKSDQPASKFLQASDVLAPDSLENSSSDNRTAPLPRYSLPETIYQILRINSVQKKPHKKRQKFYKKLNNFAKKLNRFAKKSFKRWIPFYLQLFKKSLPLETSQQAISYWDPIQTNYIYNQLKGLHCSLSESISNGIDAKLAQLKLETIGQHGTGFFPLLMFLKDLNDYIRYETTNASGETHILTFMKDENNPSNILYTFETKNPFKKTFFQSLILFFKKLLKLRNKNSNESQPKVETGTTLTIYRVNGIPLHIQENIKYFIEEKYRLSRVPLIVNGKPINNDDFLHLGHTPSPIGNKTYQSMDPVKVSIRPDGYIIQDKGIGMTADTLFNVLLNPWATSKKPRESSRTEDNPSHFYYKETDTTDNDALIQISINGVAVQTIQFPNEDKINYYTNCVIELPSNTSILNSRDEIKIEREQRQSLIKLMEHIVQEDIPIETKLKPLNSIALAIEHLTQGESQALKIWASEIEKSSVIQDFVTSMKENDTHIILPNNKELLQMFSSDQNAVYIDPLFHRFYPQKDKLLFADSKVLRGWSISLIETNNDTWDPHEILTYENVIFIDKETFRKDKIFRKEVENYIKNVSFLDNKEGFTHISHGFLQNLNNQKQWPVEKRSSLEEKDPEKEPKDSSAEESEEKSDDNMTAEKRAEKKAEKKADDIFSEEKDSSDSNTPSKAEEQTQKSQHNEVSSMAKFREKNQTLLSDASSQPVLYMKVFAEKFLPEKMLYEISRVKHIQDWKEFDKNVKSLSIYPYLVEALNRSMPFQENLASITTKCLKMLETFEKTTLISINNQKVLQSAIYNLTAIYSNDSKEALFDLAEQPIFFDEDFIHVVAYKNKRWPSIYDDMEVSPSFLDSLNRVKAKNDYKEYMTTFFNKEGIRLNGTVFQSKIINKDTKYIVLADTDLNTFFISDTTPHSEFINYPLDLNNLENQIQKDPLLYQKFSNTFEQNFHAEFAKNLSVQDIFFNEKGEREIVLSVKKDADSQPFFFKVSMNGIISILNNPDDNKPKQVSSLLGMDENHGLIYRTRISDDTNNSESNSYYRKNMQTDQIEKIDCDQIIPIPCQSSHNYKYIFIKKGKDQLILSHSSTFEKKVTIDNIIIRTGLLWDFTYNFSMDIYEEQVFLHLEEMDEDAKESEIIVSINSDLQIQKYKWNIPYVTLRPTTTTKYGGVHILDQEYNFSEIEKRSLPLDKYRLEHFFPTTDPSVMFFKSQSILDFYIMEFYEGTFVNIANKTIQKISMDQNRKLPTVYPYKDFLLAAHGSYRNQDEELYNLDKKTIDLSPFRLDPSQIVKTDLDQDITQNEFLEFMFATDSPLYELTNSHREILSNVENKIVQDGLNKNAVKMLDNLANNISHLRLEPNNNNFLFMSIFPRPIIEHLSEQSLKKLATTLLSFLDEKDLKENLQETFSFFNGLDIISLTDDDVDHFLKIFDVLIIVYKNHTELLNELPFSLLKTQGNLHSQVNAMEWIVKKMKNVNTVFPLDELEQFYMIITVYSDFFKQTKATPTEIRGSPMTEIFKEKGKEKGKGKRKGKRKGFSLGRISILTELSHKVLDKIDNNDAKSMSQLEKALKSTANSSNLAEKDRAVAKNIEGQSLGKLKQTWIRELLQNSVDAIKGEKSSNKRVDIHTYYNNITKTHHTKVTDYVGIDSLKKIVKYLLTPNFSSKREAISRDTAIGMFGRGFFTIFDQADEVIIRTGVNGKVYRIKISVQRGSDGKIQKLLVENFELHENVFQGGNLFHGTEIEKIVKVENSTEGLLEYMTTLTQVNKFCRIFPPEDVLIYFNQSRDDDHSPLNNQYKPITTVPLLHRNASYTEEERLSLQKTPIKHFSLKFNQDKLLARQFQQKQGQKTYLEKEDKEQILKEIQKIQENTYEIKIPAPMDTDLDLQETDLYESLGDIHISYHKNTEFRHKSVLTIKGTHLTDIIDTTYLKYLPKPLADYVIRGGFKIDLPKVRLTSTRSAIQDAYIDSIAVAIAMGVTKACIEMYKENNFESLHSQELDLLFSKKSLQNWLELEDHIVPEEIKEFLQNLSHGKHYYRAKEFLLNIHELLLDRDLLLKIFLYYLPTGSDSESLIDHFQQSKKTTEISAQLQSAEKIGSAT